jgi:hypothetical protein
VAAAMTAALAAGQYSSTAISANGSRVFFESTRSLRGVTWQARGRIYEALPAGPRLVAEPLEAQAADEWVQAPQVSDDGDVVAWSAMKEVTIQLPFGGPRKTAYATAIVKRESDGATWSFPGGGSLSRNGRWFASVDGLVDLTSGAVPAPAAQPFTVASDAADDGTFVAIQAGAYLLQRADGSSTPLPGLLGTSFRMDRMASVLVTTLASPPIEGALPAVDVVAYQVATGESRVLASRCLACSVLAVSGDGTHLLLRGYSTGAGTPGSARLQLYWMDTGNGEARRLSSEVTDVLAGAVSSDGGQVCYSTAAGELRCSDLSGESSWVAVAATAEVVSDGAVFVPGSRSVLKGAGLQQVRLLVGDAEARVLNGQSSQLTFVMPDGAAEGNASIEVDNPDSPFAPQLLAVQVVPAQPAVIRLLDLGGPMDESYHWPYVENGTRGGLVSAINPAQPGEELWVHMKGLGRDPLHLTYLWNEPAVEIRPQSVEPEEYNPGWQVLKLRVPDDAPPGLVWLRVVAEGQTPASLQVPVALSLQLN